jgi:hypothetical protein
MQTILAWISDNSEEADVKLIQYQEPPLSKEKLDAVRLDSIYRIVRSRPRLCMKDAHEESRSTVTQSWIPDRESSLVQTPQPNETRMGSIELKEKKHIDFLVWTQTIPGLLGAFFIIYMWIRMFSF